jgi:hypothetical protein
LDVFEKVLAPEKVLFPSFVGSSLTVLLRSVLRLTSADKAVDRPVIRVTSVELVVALLISEDKAVDRSVLRLTSVDKSVDRVVTVEESAFVAIEVVNVVYKLPSSFNAFEISNNVSNAATGAPPIKLLIRCSILVLLFYIEVLRVPSTPVALIVSTDKAVDNPVLMLVSTDKLDDNAVIRVTSVELVITLLISVDKAVDRSVLRLTSVDKSDDRSVLRLVSVDNAVDRPVVRVPSVELVIALLISEDKAVDRSVLRLTSVDKLVDRSVLRVTSVDKSDDRVVTVEESAFDAIELVNVVDKLALFPNASEILNNVFNAAGAPSIKAFIFISIRLLTSVGLVPVLDKYDPSP